MKLPPQTKQSNTPATLPKDGMSRANQLLPYLPFGKTTLFDWVRKGKFPKPIKLSPTMTAWRNSDVLEWLDNPTAWEQNNAN